MQWEIPREQLDRLAQAIGDIAHAAAAAVRELVETMTPLFRSIASLLTARGAWLTDELLKPFATPKEWRIYKHTKKQRIKKKYRDRFVRRWMEQS